MSRRRVSRKRGPRCRHWCFTSFLEILPITFDKDIVRYCIYQREISPETKREHFQGYIEFFNDQRVGQVKTVLGECHCEPRKGTREQARKYCRKLATAISGTQVEFGVWRENIAHKRKLCDMLKSNMSLDDIITESPISYVRCHRGLERLFSLRTAKIAKRYRKVEVLVFWGPTGSGKTRRAAEEPDHFFMPLGEKFWFDGYQGEKCLIIDDFRGEIKYSFLLRLLHGHECQVPIKGGFVWAQWTKVIITSNLEPKGWYPKQSHIDPLMRRITEVVRLPIEDVREYILVD